MMIHTVQQGDTVNSIAEQYHIPVNRLEQDNDLSPNAVLSIGRALMIAYPEQVHTVQAGDTLDSIASSYGVSTLQLLRNNPQLSDRNHYALNSGEELIIRYPEKIREMKVIGYANSFITPQVLNKTLPYLTYLTILNYRVTATGDLVGIDDTQIIQTAKEFGVAPIMFVSSITEQGTGNFGVTHNILNHPDIQKRFIDNILNVLESKGYFGLELSFVQVIPDDLTHYIEFLANLTSQLNTEGFEVFVSLIPSTLGYQSGIPYTASYFSDIGKAVNHVILLTYLWPSAFISQVSETTVSFLRDYISFAVTQIPSDKIFTGIARMGYVWELPYVEGQTPGRFITNSGAVNLANQLGATLEFDELTQTPYFYFNDSGVEHYVWFKDARSIDAIILLVNEYNLAGIAIWNIMYYYTPMWLVLNSQYDIAHVSFPSKEEPAQLL